VELFLGNVVDARNSHLEGEVGGYGDDDSGPMNLKRQCGGSNLGCLKTPFSG
jgi:hypothetical protein